MKSTALHKKVAKELCREICAGMTTLLESGPSYGGYVAMKRSAVTKIVLKAWPKVSAAALSRIEVRTPLIPAYQKIKAVDVRRIEEVLAAEITAPEPTLAPKAKPSAVKRK